MGSGEYVWRSEGSLLGESVLFTIYVRGIKLRHETWHQEYLPAEPSFWAKFQELIKIKAFLLAVSLLDLMLGRNNPGSFGKAASALKPWVSLQSLTSALSYPGADVGIGPVRKLNFPSSLLFRRMWSNIP